MNERVRKMKKILILLLLLSLLLVLVMVKDIFDKFIVVDGFIISLFVDDVENVC